MAPSSPLTIKAVAIASANPPSGPITVADFAPSQKKFASYISSSIAGALLLISSGIGLAQGNTRALLMTLPVLVGLTWVCRAIAKGEISIKSDMG